MSLSKHYIRRFRPGAEGFSRPVARQIFITMLAAMILAIVTAGLTPAIALAQGSPGSALGSDDSSTYGDAQDRAEEARENASPQERENAESMSPNDEGPISESGDESRDQMENATPEEEQNADRVDGGSDEPGTQEEAQDSGTEQAENATPEEEANADSVDGESEGGGFLDGIAIDMFKSIGGWIGDGVEEAADKRTEDLSNQITDGRYMLEPPSNDLTRIYDDMGNFVGPIAIVLFLFLGLKMCLAGANYNTAYAARTGIPRIILVIAGIAFMPEIIGVVADLTREIANAVVDEQAMQEGFTRLEEGKEIRQWLGLSGLGDGIFSLIKFILGVLILFAIAVRNLIFGLLYVVGPLAIGLYGIAQFSDVAGAWLRGILACYVITILWALEFGIGYRFVADPGLLTGGAGDWAPLPLLLSIGILWLVWKTPWWVFQWAFYSYSAGGGGGASGARTAISLLGLFKGLKGSK